MSLKWKRQPDGSYVSEAGTITGCTGDWQYHGRIYSMRRSYLADLKDDVEVLWRQHIETSKPMSLIQIREAALRAIVERDNLNDMKPIAIAALRQCVETRVFSTELEAALKAWWKQRGGVVI